MIRKALGHATSSSGPRSDRDREGAGSRPGQDPPDAAVHARPGRRAGVRGAAGHAGRRGADRPAPAAGSIVLDGEPGAWLPPGFEVIAQRGDGLDERLAAAFEDVGEAALLVGMDTPQVTPALLDAGLAGVAEGDSAFGAALDGGYWAIGLRTPDAAVFADVPMSSSRTGAVQRARLAILGLRPAILPPLRDVDTIEDALAVAAEAPDTRFATELAVVAEDAAGGGMTALDEPRRRVVRDDAAAAPRRRALRAPARLRRRAPARRRARSRAPGCGSPTGASSRCRSTAGWRPPTRPTSRSWRASRRPCSTSAAARAATSPRCARRASAGSAWTSPPSPCGSRAGAGADAINGSLWSQVPRAGSWRTILLLDGNIGIGGAPILLLRRAGELLAPGGAIVVETDPRGRADRARQGPAGGAGRRVRVVPLGTGRCGRRRRGGGARGARGRGGPRARGPHLRNAQTPVRTLRSCSPLRPARSARASSARPCAGRG